MLIKLSEMASQRGKYVLPEPQTWAEMTTTGLEVNHYYQHYKLSSICLQIYYVAALISIVIIAIVVILILRQHNNMLL